MSGEQRACGVCANRAGVAAGVRAAWAARAARDSTGEGEAAGGKREECVRASSRQAERVCVCALLPAGRAKGRKVVR